MIYYYLFFFFFSSRRRHTRCLSDWSSDVCSSDLQHGARQRSLDEIDRTLRFEGVDYEPAHLEVRHVRGWVGQVENLTVGLLVQGCLKKGLCHVVHMDSRSPLALLHLDGAASVRSTNGLKA